MNGIKKLQEKWDEEPVQVIAVASLAAASIAKLINAVSAAQGRRAYSKQVNHSIKKRKK
jgi:hypothetical protein